MRQQKRCEESGCVRNATVRGKCTLHYSRMYAAWKRSVEEFPPVLLEPKWEFLGKEDELAEMTERLEQQKEEIKCQNF